MVRALVAFALLVFAQTALASAQDRWVRVATVELLPGQNIVELLDAWQWHGMFKAIAWQTKNGTLSPEELILLYSDCREQNIKLKSRPTKKTRQLALDHRQSYIDAAFLLFAKVARKTTLEIWGLQSKEGAAALRPSFPVRAGFQIDFRVDRQLLHACPNPRQDSYDQIQLLASGQAVHVKGLKITYESDQTELIEVDSTVRNDTRSELLRLKGSERFRLLELTYNARPGVQEKAEIKLDLSSSLDLIEKSGRPKPGEPPEVRNACAFPCRNPDFCVENNTCTPVMVFFGTNRERKDPADRVGFGPERGEALSLGRAIVTVPRYHGIGKVERPSYWSTLISWRKGEDPERHFAVPKGGVEIFTSPEQFISAIQAAFGELTEFRDHAFIYVHGFKVEFDDALFRVAQMTYDLGVDRNHSRIPFGMPFLFSWPARGGLLDYVTDKESALLAEPHLRSFLELIVTQSKPKYVHLIAHSMGNQVLLNVLTQISAARPDIKFNQIILAAPDVDRKVFLNMAARIKPVAESITLYASSQDEAMLVSRRLHSGLPRAGDVTMEGPAVVSGVDTIDISALSTEFLVASHSKYAEDISLLKDVGALLRKGIRPPHDRTPVLKRVPTGTLEFWSYPK